ncbi:MAG: hypothetical protein WCG35_04620 [Betaproteobacteria bacterium]
MRFVFFVLIVFACSASATEVDWQTSGDTTIYSYASIMRLQSDSIVNPSNQFARLEQNNENLEARLNLKAENETFLIKARPIIILKKSYNSFSHDSHHEAYLSQWQVRMRANDSISLDAGRVLLNWGAAQFRSPSSPFYFDNGRSNPMLELSGVDVVKVTLATDKHGSAQVGYVVDSGYQSPQPDPWRNSWLFKVDRHGDRWAAGVAIVKPQVRSDFFGVNGQISINDALMLYTEMSSATQSNVLNSPANVTLPFSVSSESSRKSTELIGASYTFENGQSFMAEYLHEGQGYTPAEERAYFLRAVNQPAMALGLAPRLLGRDYLYFVLQSNQLESKRYWRVMMTHSMTDHSNEISGYGEALVYKQVSAFAIGVLHGKNAQQEFSSLFENSITLGLKIALP